MTWKKIRLYFTTVVWVALGVGHIAHGESLSPQEYLVKAAFLYNFARFVEWPAGAFADDRTPVTLGILGKDPFGEIIESIRGKTVRDRELVIRRFVSMEEMEECHILFISQSEHKRLARIFVKLKDWSVLTVGDMEKFAHRGGIINLIIVEGKVRLEVNVDVAKRSGLEISSNLLKLARIVKSEQTGEKN